MTCSSSRPAYDGGFTFSGFAALFAAFMLLAALSAASYAVCVRYAERARCEACQRGFTRAALLYRSEHGGSAPDSLDDLRPYVTGYVTTVKCPGDGRMLLWDAARSEAYCSYPGH